MHTFQQLLYGLVIQLAINPIVTVYSQSNIAISDCQNSCSGHGRCSNSPYFICSCDEGWGAATDIAEYKTPDCSLRTCPSGKSWFGIPSSTTAAHDLTECSGNGACQRDLGECLCFPPWTGAACDRVECFNQCSGHGKCMTMRQYALLDEGFPLTASAGSYTGFDDATWDATLISGCHCDSAWSVGLNSGETQAAEYFGPDCSKIRCPTGDDPMTSRVETDCENRADNGASTACSNNHYYTSTACTTLGYWCSAKKTCNDASDCGGLALAGGRETSKFHCEAAAGSWSATNVGASGNLCHVDCSNRGICDHSVGTCACFPGFKGANCATVDASSFNEV